MFQVKYLVVLLLLCGNAYAWGDETPIVGNETLNTGFNPFINISSQENPFEYTYGREIMNMPFTQGSYTSNDAIAICTNYKIYKQIWDGSSYVQIDECNISIDTCINLNYDANKDQYVLPDNYNNVMTNGFLVKRYFQELINSDNQYCNTYNNSDESDNPDILYTYIDIDVEDGEIYQGYIYISIDNIGEQELTTGETDYGFGTGRGADGGSGDIYQGLNVGCSNGDTEGIGDAFKMLFWLLIPLIFILCVIKMIGKIL